MTKRVGIYAGTFDPIHDGHIAFALATLQTCKLDEVVFLPERFPRKKQEVTDIEQRRAWLEEAVQSKPQLSIQISQSYQFTVQDTLPELIKHYGKAKITLLIGSDVARHLYLWPGIATLCQQVTFAIGLRGTDTQEEIDGIMSDLSQKLQADVTYKVIKASFAGLSSSQVRSSK